MSAFVSALVVSTFLCANPALEAAPGALGGVTLYNPTPWQGPALAEVPTGRIAAPGLIDWENVRLLVDGREAPFLIREGRAHWQAQLRSPALPPRAEDLLVFWCAVPPGSWARVDVVSGAPSSSAAIERTDSALKVNYEHVQAVLDASTGMLTSLHIYGTPLLSEPMSATFNHVDTNSFATTGAIGPGYLPFSVEFQRGAALPSLAALASVASTPAMTEVNFVLTPEGGPAMGLTYRIHAAGLVEIVADERPWQGASPWLNAAAQFSLRMAGVVEPLPYHEERMPFYGFKDYNGAFDQTAQHITLGETHIIALGEETVNGRRWQRRLFAWAGTQEASVTNAVEILDEGLIVLPVPLCSKPVGDAVKLEFPPEAKTIAGLLSDVLAAHGVTVSENAAASIRLEIGEDPGMAIDVDGFEIRASEQDVIIHSTNLLGLHRAVRAIAAHAKRHELKSGLPLIAENPVVPLRGGGFGGGNFEVDFPYGSDENWQRVFDGLLDSGMNVFWCLGMWSNWKFPITYKYIPELQSDSPEAYDESSGVLFPEAAQHREHALRLLEYLHARGAPVYLWLPIGCVPTTFLDRYPEALKPGSVEEFWGRPKGTPCFTHPMYHAYLNAFLRELVETYALDGVVLVRDDNGGVCDCERCKAFVADSRTKSAVWEQYLQIYDTLRRLGFKGAIGVYPYFDGYTPALDPLLPEDMIVAGHGASLAALARRHGRVGHMPDTWLDNLYTNFRLPSTPRVRRLLADRGTFWIGGAYCGTELPWEGLGYFGWEPTATANSLRYHWGERTFGPEAALSFVALNDAYEAMWDINARYLIPNVWGQLPPEERERITRDAMHGLALFAERFAMLRKNVEEEKHATWLSHLELWPVFFEYHLRRMGRFAEISDLVKSHRDAIDAGGRLPEDVRSNVLSKYAETYEWAERYRGALAAAPGDMLASTRNMTMPYKEWMSGCDGWLDPLLERPQFRGTMEIPEVTADAGQPFTVHVSLHNTGICPWVEKAEQVVEFSKEGQELGLPARWVLTGEPIAPGDQRELTFEGKAPAGPGSAQVAIAFYNPFRAPTKIVEKTFKITWESK
ncbi:MAG: beta-galactosidase [Candidatus Hydrogenedentes bacterium]|nr:beta-galactosidase [Candidatus Hydrogenedentota bacterium]